VRHPLLLGDVAAAWQDAPRPGQLGATGRAVASPSAARTGGYFYLATSGHFYLATELPTRATDSSHYLREQPLATPPTPAGVFRGAAVDLRIQTPSEDIRAGIERMDTMWEMNGVEWLDAIHRHYDRTWTLPVHVACESEPSADLGFFPMRSWRLGVAFVMSRPGGRTTKFRATAREP
jgi:hypothetical protein